MSYERSVRREPLFFVRPSENPKTRKTVPLDELAGDIADRLFDEINEARVSPPTRMGPTSTEATGIHAPAGGPVDGGRRRAARGERRRSRGRRRAVLPRRFGFALGSGFRAGLAGKG